MNDKNNVQSIFCDAKSNTFEAGKVLNIALYENPGVSYFCYVPINHHVENCTVMVSVHGISRNAQQHVERFLSLAEVYGVILIAPLFSHEKFPKYQRLIGNPKPADLILLDIVQDAAQRMKKTIKQFHLFGHSGGGQFAHRFTMSHPQCVLSLAIGAAGWYTFPDQAQKFPYGLREARLPKNDPMAFLRVPTAVFIGARDNKRDTALRKTPRIDAQQGSTRITRGRSWIEAMQRAADRQGCHAAFQFQILPGSRHSFLHCAKKGQLCERVFYHFFGEVADAKSA